MIGSLDVIYRTLIKLGFHEIDVKNSLSATTSANIEDHLDWVNDKLCKNQMLHKFYFFKLY